MKAFWVINAANIILAICIICGALLITSCSSPPPSSTTSKIINTTQTPNKTKSLLTASATSTEEKQKPTQTPSVTITSQTTTTQKTSISFTETPKRTVTSTKQATLRPNEWKKLPVIPTIHPDVKKIFMHGIELGNNPKAFSKIGDCGSTPAWFLGDFDRGEKFYDLGDYDTLKDVIDYYQGSFGRTSLAARSGFNASSLFVSIWADRSYCNSNEAPLACEYRQFKPSLAFIMLGSNDVWHPEEFEPQMRKIIDYSLEKGVIPILSTKADNIEEDGRINDTIARLSQEYHIPLWNFWLAMEDLPNRGLQEDNVHLTFGRNFFDDPEVMQKAWSVRNLSALQVLDAIWKEVSGLR